MREFLKLCILVLGFALTACQSKPTTALEESVNALANNTVIVDTRSPLQYESFHVEGAVSIRAEDFTILQNPKAAKRFRRWRMISDLDSIISDLARKGIHRNRRVILLAETENALSNKRLEWLLKNLEVDDVRRQSIDDFMKTNSGRYAYPKSQDVWRLRSSDLFQREFIFDKSDRCFANPKRWKDGYCL